MFIKVSNLFEMGKETVSNIKIIGDQVTLYLLVLLDEVQHLTLVQVMHP